jgi:hypothetical protein
VVAAPVGDAPVHVLVQYDADEKSDGDVDSVPPTGQKVLPEEFVILSVHSIVALFRTQAGVRGRHAH